MRLTFILLCSLYIFVNCAAAQDGSRLRQGFERLDANKDGQLSATELKTVPRLESRLEGADQDNDGLLSFREFAGAIARSMRRPAPPEEAGGAFGAGDRTRTIDVEGQERRYRIHVPPNYTADRKTPVVVAFHGGGGNPQSMIRLSGLNEKADDAGFVVVYPFGSGTDKDKNLTFNAGNVGGYAKRKKIDDVGFTKALLGDLEAVVNVDKERVFATGISNGGMMAYRVASELADRFAAIAPVGGPMGTAECNPASPVSVIHFHGTADELAPFNGGRGKGTSNVPASMRPEFFSVEHSINCWVEANGCAKEPTVTPMPDTADDGMRVIRKVWGEGKNGSEVVLYEIDGGGHTWPGMEPPVAMLGASTTDISANDLMWDFFQKHAKRAHKVKSADAVHTGLTEEGLSGSVNPRGNVLMYHGPGGAIFEFVEWRQNQQTGSELTRPERLFQRLDADNDGKVTQAEAGGPDWFDRLDRNGDGKLSGNELTQFPSLARILRFADRDQDGALSIEELRTVSARWPGREASPGGTSEAKPAPAGSDKPKDDADKAANKALNLRYHAMDFDGDGVVTQREFPNQTIFKVFDQDRSGEITRTEFVAKLGKSAERGPITPESALVPIGKQVDWFTFEKDYFPGTRDPNGQLLGGTELMWLTAHEGKLFAGTSMLKSDVTVKPYPGYPGPQILRKDRGDGPWIAEESFGRDHLRINCLEVLRFTEDPDGKPLPKPVSLLAAGLYDIRRGEKWLTVAVRNDETGTWTLSRIAPLPEDQPGYAGIRDLIVHDGEVFAAADFGGIYRGVYDPQAPGRLRWTPENEMAGGPYGRPQRMEICDGVLYAAFGYSNQRQRGKQGGLFRRISGAKPRWERVYSWFENEGPFEFLMRGLTTVTGSDGKPALLGALERPPLPVIRRIEPTNEFAATDEINYENYFANVFDAWPNVGVFMTGAALNRFTPFTRPDDGRAVYLVTTFVIHPRSPQAGSNGAYFLVRNGPGSYDWGAIKDPANQPDGVRLQGVRTIEPSPFPDEKGKVWYFGGFAADFAYVRDTAWIYKGTLQKGEEYKP
ncbi:transaldolase/EF-hand domain-containing protein [Sedimentisphaera cyanobacteriorum]|uniref:Transaldolase/EF-hand domain-containing protein n=1 Tax=Sedimentisphaera cyanobacteriorum TaxID=1940790 RepID=A0A1Q2HRG2_9BACT|nr:EF-hand domain-containing protein [Sedimentisphaera cyanobacteriorum]AQQ09836.1 transaldolase/EF-hand domain-containing protein [Sedimentisphaera cyanobacteriorum]